MENSKTDPDKTEILIIRRGGGDDHAAHKGGAWKIAYADFVTAMMAFFLVMWLINSANEATRARVASYFNPIKLTDAKPATRGVDDATENKQSAGPGSAPQSGQEGSTGKSPQPANPVETARASAEKREEQLMQNPFRALEALSTEGTGNPTGRTVEITSEKTGDPFDPKAWEALRRGTKGADAGTAPGQTVADTGDSQQTKVPGGAGTQLVIDEKPTAIATSTQPADVKSTSGETHSPTSSADHGTQPNKGQVPQDQAAGDKDQNGQGGSAAKAASATDAQAQEMADVMRDKILQAAARAGAANNLNISVKMTSEGLLISLADKTGTSMFEIGSAEPTPPLVALVSAIGNLLETEQGKIVVRGHTDARQYKNLKFDNWQLSTARAHMASYMLMRGGFSEDRIFRIEGYGSTSLVEGSDPFAAENRRVEFLLKP